MESTVPYDTKNITNIIIRIRTVRLLIIYSIILLVYYSTVA